MTTYKSDHYQPEYQDSLVPTLVHDGRPVIQSSNIAEYLDEKYPEPMLLGCDPAERSETRRLISWFDVKFQNEVTANLVDEKIMKRFLANLLKKC